MFILLNNDLTTLNNKPLQGGIEPTAFPTGLLDGMLQLTGLISTIVMILIIIIVVINTFRTLLAIIGVGIPELFNIVETDENNNKLGFGYDSVTKGLSIWKSEVKDLGVTVNTSELTDNWGQFVHYIKEYGKPIEKEEELFHLMINDLAKLTNNIDNHYDKNALNTVVNQYYTKITKNFISMLLELRKALESKDKELYASLYLKYEKELSYLENSVEYLVKKV